MFRKSFHLLTVCFLAIMLFALFLGALSAPARSQGDGSVPASSDTLPDALRHGKWPAQVAAHSGAIKPDRHGPQRNDPAEGIPKHAYSPFDERRNRDYPCPPGGCEAEKDHVLIKLAANVRIRGVKLQGAWTEDAGLNKALATQGVVRLEPVFPAARPPRPGETVETPEGLRVPKPDLSRWYRAYLNDKGADVRAVAEALSGAPGIAWAEPDYVRKLAEEPRSGRTREKVEKEKSETAQPSDPLYAQQWHLAATNVPQAWDYLQSQGLPPGGSRDIVVAVIDTGVDYTHPDLAANMWTNSREIPDNGVDDDGNGFVDDVHGVDVITNSGDPQDDHGHGTHVAGIIAAQANNGIGGVGVAYNVQIMAIKAAQYSGVLSSSDIAEGITYAVQQGADVINMSFGGYTRSQVEEDALAVAFGQAVLVAAAGNDGKVNLPCPLGRDMYPAAYNWVLGVMASTPSGGRAAFSNYDCTPHDSHEYELMAPGVDVWSTLPNEQYAAWDGTSMATPIVSGIAALARTKWSDKDVYSSRFIMGQIAANTQGGIGGVADAYAALTRAPQPELSYLEHWLFDTAAQDPTNDDDGIVDAGETIDLAIVIRNHWGKADPVTVTLEAWAEGAFQPDPYVTMITDTVSYGAIGSFNVDDNGLIYDDQGVITGVRHPFRFTVDPNTPNDHVIPFRLTMTARNGLDPTDTTVYTFTSRFYLIVQRGRELPAVISQTMTLSQEYFWIVPGQTLIEAGVTVSITNGAQVQFGAPNPSDPYSTPTTPFIQVEGNLNVLGTVSEPVEIFPSEILQENVRIYNYSTANLKYVRIRNPVIGEPWTVTPSAGASSIEHCYFDDNGLHAYKPDGSMYLRIIANSLSECILHKLEWIAPSGGGPETNPVRSGSTDLVLFDAVKSAPYVGPNYWDNCEGTFSCRRFTISGHDPVRNSVFQQDNSADNTAMRLVFRGDGDWATFGSAESAVQGTYILQNAFLSKYWDPDPWHWMQMFAYIPRDRYVSLAYNFWGTTSTQIIEAAIMDYSDDFNKGQLVYQPILTTPVTTTYPFVVDVLLSTASYTNASALNGPTPIVGAEPVTFTVTFNRDMDTSVQPSVSFGPDVPETDYTIHPIEGGWVDPRTWVGTFNVTPVTGDGYQLMRIAGPARAADDPWLVIGDDVERFRFEIQTSGTEAMNLQATGGEGYVDLSWTQDDFDLLAGFNIYRSTSISGTYTLVNQGLIPPDQRTFRDTNVQPGQPYYYYFTVVKTDMSESDPSNIASATPIDTIPPNISHTPVTEAPPGLPLTLFADVTDNVGVQGVTLYYRHIGDTSYQNKAMVNTTGNRYSATIEGAFVTSPGIEYYIEATDGVSTVRYGRPEYPYQITVVDRPVVTAVSPSRGPTSGGTVVTIAGSNFKAGASVTFGGAVASNVTVLSSSQITCTTPAHFPETVDVTVTNPDGQSGTLLRGFTYESDVASLSLPDTGGGQHRIVQVPINAANVQGLLAADLTVTFDPTVLSARGASTGNLTPGWNLVVNTGTAGQISLSMASSSSVTGSGILAYLEFEVVGSPGVTTTLHFAGASLNDGAIPVDTADGSFNVNLVYDVSGTVRFWNGGAGVPGVLLTLEGDRVYTGATDAAGAYTVGGAPAGAYTLTPGKSDDVNGISAYDASLVLQHAAGLITLTGYAATAADVNKSGAITSMDASYILQKAVDLITLPFPGAGVVWDFDPPSRTYANLNSDQTGQDFTAVLLGDVSGNWSAGGTLGSSAALTGAPAAIRVDSSPPDASGTVTATVWLDPAGARVYSLDLVLRYDPESATVVDVVSGPLADGLILSHNTSRAGEVRVAMAGALPLTEQGPLLTVRLRSADPAQPVMVTPAWGQVNEGAIPLRLEGSQRGTFRLYLPVVAR